MSSNHTRPTISLAVGGVILTAAAIVWAQQTDEILLIEQPVAHDLYAARREVEVRSTIEGDLVAAGQQVTVAGFVTGDVIAAAQTIEIRSDVSDDVRAAGQHVRIAAPVSGHVVAAGQSVSVDRDVGDWAWLAGNTVDVLGNVGGDLKIRANEITIDSEIVGNVEAVGDGLNVGPNAVVHGNLTWRSRNSADISPDAQIDGEFVAELLPGLVDELATGSTYSLPLNLIVAVIVLFLLFSRPLRASADRIATRPGRSLLLGLAVFLVTPLLAALLIFTGIGVWLGFAVFFIYLVVLLLGVLTGLFAVSDKVLRRFREQPAVWQSLASIFVTVVAAGLLAKIPWLGLILVMAILLTGLGALCWNSWTTLRGIGQQGLQPSS